MTDEKVPAGTVTTLAALHNRPVSLVEESWLGGNCHGSVYYSHQITKLRDDETGDLFFVVGLLELKFPDGTTFRGNETGCLRRLKAWAAAHPGEHSDRIDTLAN